MCQEQYTTSKREFKQLTYKERIKIVGLSNICHTFLEITIVEIPSMPCLYFNLLHILNIFRLDLAILMASLENHYILSPNILICF